MDAVHARLLARGTDPSLLLQQLGEPPDALGKLLAENRAGVAAVADLDRVAWTRLLDAARERARVVADNVIRKAAAAARDRNDIEVLAFREALARGLRVFLEQQLQLQQSGPPMPAVASPFAEGARFNHVRAEHLQSLSTAPFAASIQTFLTAEWHQLANRDLARAATTLTFAKRREGVFLRVHPTQDDRRFPALVSIAQLLSAFPHEVNLKLQTRCCEVSHVVAFAGSYDIHHGANGNAEGIVAAYVVGTAARALDEPGGTLRVSDLEGHFTIPLRAGRVVLLRGNNSSCARKLKLQLSEGNVFLVCVHS